MPMAIVQYASDAGASLTGTDPQNTLRLQSFIIYSRTQPPNSQIGLLRLLDIFSNAQPSPQVLDV